ncbi:protoporphyrinogen oxidase [Salirhabdus salicampi]|uniref:protoporphyrinogen oxidase n=1 Tax=Salirhabdus salicampi TaxID=476102 RepID=UPI0020C263BD|nr:protoporphyrinogen oxidase [Salirhabdus salicampi]MCP8615524.1 protoporphyrinogen oxidase [Salirhabdus salicampi]
MNEQRKRIVIIGGGITGLSAAYYLQKEIKEKNLPYDVMLIEANEHLGGKIDTVHKDGYVIERGPDSFLERKQSAAQLVKDVGLEDDLVRNATGQAYILLKEKLHPIPQGSFMGIPTSVKPFLFSNLFSWKGKLRAGGDFFLPKSQPQDDQSLGLFFRRRLGDEIVENLIEPLLSGIYAGDIDRLSLMATFPNFYNLEQEYGSLIKGLNKTVPKKAKSQKKKGVFLTLKSGLSSLVSQLEDELKKSPFVTVHKQSVVQHITKEHDKYRITVKGKEETIAHSIVLATPHFVTQKILSQYDFLKTYKEMPATSVANVVLGFNKQDIPNMMDGTGFVVSRNSNHRITACTWTHKKWPHTTPDGQIMLRSYVGKPSDQEIVHLSDDEIETIVREDLKNVMNIDANPSFSLVTRWKQAMPQYIVGHKERVEDTKNHMKEYLPGVFLAGSSYEGIGIPDCINQGIGAKEDALSFLNK